MTSSVFTYFFTNIIVWKLPSAEVFCLDKITITYIITLWVLNWLYLKNFSFFHPYIMVTTKNVSLSYEDIFLILLNSLTFEKTIRKLSIQ